MSDSKTLRVIDFHVHIGLKENWHEWVQAYQMAAQSEFYEHYEKMVNPDQFALYLEAHHIDKAVILPEISPITTGIVTNEYVFEFCKNHDIFLPFCTVNPSLSKRPDREFKKYIQMGARGLKLYPSYNHFFPNERRMYTLYEIAQDSQIPVLVHTGSSVFKGSKLKYADPLALDDVAADFPGLDILMAHGGRGLWYQEAFFLSRLHPRLYLEISGLPPKNLLKYFPDLEKNIDKVVYGSDWPGIKTISSNIEAIRGLPLAEDAVEKILYKNAARILKL
jgi:predicted TIM-barrel fold metal-dependent hydrolase